MVLIGLRNNATRYDLRQRQSFSEGPEYALEMATRWAYRPMRGKEVQLSGSERLVAVG